MHSGSTIYNIWSFDEYIQQCCDKWEKLHDKYRNNKEVALTGEKNNRRNWKKKMTLME